MTNSSQGPLFRSAVVLQIIIAVVVTTSILMFAVFAYGPDIDGRTPPLSDDIKGFLIGFGIIAGYIWSAIQLKRGTSAGWWLSLCLDVILSLSFMSLVLGDIREIPRESAAIYRSDLSVHCPILLFGLAGIVMLLVSRLPRRSEPESL